MRASMHTHNIFYYIFARVSSTKKRAILALGFEKQKAPFGSCTPSTLPLGVFLFLRLASKLARFLDHSLFLLRTKTPFIS